MLSFRNQFHMRPLAKKHRKQSKTQSIPTLKDLYFQKLEEFIPTICTGCNKSLGNQPHILESNGTKCIGCLAKNIRKNNDYLVVSPRKKYSQNAPFVLHKELKLLKAIQRYGIDSRELILEDMGKDMTEQELEKWVSWLFGTTQQQIVKNSCNSSEEGTISSLKKKMTKVKNRLSTEVYRSKQEEVLKEIKEKQVKFIDILLSTLHEKSNPDEVNFLLSMKAKETEEANSIDAKLVAIMKRTHFSSKFCSIPRQKVDKQVAQRSDQWQAYQLQSSQNLLQKSKVQAQLCLQFQLLKKAQADNVSLSALKQSQIVKKPGRQPKHNKTKLIYKY